jgi:hypothetical protein
MYSMNAVGMLARTWGREILVRAEKFGPKENQKNGADTPLYRPHFALPRQMIGIGMQKQLIEISIEMEKVLGQ